MDKPKAEESWTNSLFSKILGPSATPLSQTPAVGPQPIQSKVPEASASSNTAVPAPLKSIRTPHERATSHSHPELAFSPTDIGIWEVDNTRRPGERAPSEGFSSFSSWFGGSKTAGSK